jgi:hypothetical protein
MGQPGQDSWEKTAGQAGQNREGKEKQGQEQNSLDRIVRTGQLE